MGLSKSKSTQTSDPWAPAQPFILKGLQQSGAVFDAQQPTLNKYAQQQYDTYGRTAAGAEAGIHGAQGVVNSTLNGDSLNGNPYMQKQIDLTNRDTTNAVNSQFEGAGRYGSGMHAGILAKAIADSENQTRFANYSQERQNQINAVGQASGLMGGAQSSLNNAAELPWIGVGALNGNVRQASNGYGTQTTKSAPAWGPMLLQAAGNAAQAAAMASDPRVKQNIVKVGEDADGLGWYDFDYRQDTGLDLPAWRQRGVMANEVAELRPWALGEPVSGYATVYYDRLEA